MARSNDWTVLSIHPVTGPLNTRSRPADVPPGGFRWKEAFQTRSGGPSGSLCRRAGFQRFFSDYRYDDDGVSLSDPSHGAGNHYHNHDWHFRNGDREPITFALESTANDGTRRFFAGTQSAVAVLDQDAGTYTEIISGAGAPGCVWKGAQLQDELILCNDHDGIRHHTLGSSNTGVISDLDSLHVSQSKIAVMFNGFIMLMNVVVNGDRQSSRIYWSDLNLPTTFNPGTEGSLSGFQDLDYGDDILGALPLLGNLYIYTRRSIWKCTTGGATESDIFTFARVYNEPKNQAGCLTYPNTLVSDGQNHWYMSRDGIYNFNPYIAAPERAEWLHDADGVIYTKGDTKLDSTYCQSPVAEYVTADRELWISWPSADRSGINNLTFIANLQYKTADVMRVGFTTLVNFRRAPTSQEECNETQDLVGACGADWCLKSIGGVYFYEYAIIASNGDRSVDLSELDAGYIQLGYNSLIAGLIPTGLHDREKLVRLVNIQDDVREQDTPCKLRVRIGNSYQNVDLNEAGQKCAPLWRTIGTKLLTCPSTMTLAQMQANNIRPSVGKDFKCYEQGRYLFFEISVIGSDGGLAIGGDACFQQFDFDCLAISKP